MPGLRPKNPLCYISVFSRNRPKQCPAWRQFHHAYRCSFSDLLPAQALRGEMRETKLVLSKSQSFKFWISCGAFFCTCKRAKFACNDPMIYIAMLNVNQIELLQNMNYITLMPYPVLYSTVWNFPNRSVVDQWLMQIVHVIQLAPVNPMKAVQLQNSKLAANTS